MSENPRQFSSIDSSDANLHGSLTNRPPSNSPVGDPINFEELNRQVTNQRTQPGYIYKESTPEYVLRREREIAASLRFKQEAVDKQAAIALQEQQNQIQRNEIRNRISNNTPSDPEVASPRPESRLAQQQRSTPERNPPPSPITPPPTPNTSGARVNSLVEPTQTPSPAMQRQPMLSPPGQLEFQLPAPPPQMGRLLIPGVANGIFSTGTRILGGQPIEQAVSGGIATAAGTVVGGLVGGTLFGPVGAFLGGTVGGIIGGYISDQFFAQQLPSPVQPPVQPPNYPPFLGGQVYGALYAITHTAYTTEGVEYAVYNSHLFGPIGDVTYSGSPKRGHLTCSGSYDEDQLPKAGTDYILPVLPAGFRWKVTALEQITVGFPGGGGDLPGYHAPPPNNRPGYFNDPPLNTDNTIPSGNPAAGTNKGKNNDVAASKPSGGSPRGDGGDWVPGAYLAPGLFPGPEASPSNLGGSLPGIAPNASSDAGGFPGTLPTLGDLAAPRIGLTVTPGTGGFATVTPSTGGFATVTPSTGGFATVTPATVTYSEGNDSQGNSYAADGTITPPSGGVIAATADQNQPLGTTPNNIPEAKPPTPTPDAFSPFPKEMTAPQISPTVDPTVAANKKALDDQLTKITAIATAIAALTPIIQGVPDAIAQNPNVRAANKETTKGAVCEIAQPGGCLGNALDNSANKVNQNNNQNTANLLDKINAGANAAQLALLELINTKLGNLLPGGLSGTFTRLWQTLQVDRILNILVLVTTFHNALMLSNNLAQTLFSAMDNIGQAVGFKWKNEKGEDTGFGGIASEWTASFFKGIFGVENYTSLVSNYKKANRIYQASANILNSIQSVGASILSGLEVIGGWNANIGNALKRFGTVGEKAYAWMNPNVNFQNKYFTALENVTNVVSQIDQVASETLSIKESIGQITEQKKEIEDSLKQNDASKQKPDVPEAIKLAQKQTESKVASAALPLVENDKEPDNEDN